MLHPAEGEYLLSIYLPQQKGTINEYKKLLYKKQHTCLKVLQLRYCGRDSIIQVRNRFSCQQSAYGDKSNHTLTAILNFMAIKSNSPSKTTRTWVVF